MNKPTILFAVQHEELRRSVKKAFENQQLQIVETSSCRDALRCFERMPLHLLILESPWRDDWDSLALAEHIRIRDRRFPIILVTTHGSVRLAISALRHGFKDFFELPISGNDLADAVKRCLNTRDKPLPGDMVSTSTFQDPFVGTSLPMQKIKAYLRKVADVDSHVLITGETGTGKELAASYIHNLSERSNNPFIAINCAALPDSLLESELFGYEKGAFTGAQNAYPGKLRLAEGGTVFLDEIGDMNAYAQSKILRFLESKEIYPLGAKRSVLPNIRIIAATNRHLETMMLVKEFREDLYFRLNIARVHLTPLRERKEDIPELLNFYLERLNRQFSKNLVGFSVEALAALLDYNWPGNVRELKNVLESVFIDAPNERIGRDDLPESIRRFGEIEDFSDRKEREQLLAALCASNWNKTKAAEQLQCSRMTLYRKMDKLRISDKKAH